MKHFLSIESLTGDEIRTLVQQGRALKAERGNHREQPLAGQTWAMMFSKSSTRTRVSFEVGIRELGGQTFFLSASDIQLGRGEPIKDTARVLGRMVNGAIIRTFGQDEVEEFAEFGGIPTINALTDAEHPCQILADLLTILELRGSYDDMVLTYVGDADCNVPRSWIWAAARLGFELRLAAPPTYRPSKAWLDGTGANVKVFDDPEAAATDADVLYTDVWVSMGKEEESAYRMAQLQGYQIDGALVEKANEPIVLHCLPAYRGKEITEAVLEAHAGSIFQQAENRLHAQKAVLAALA